MVPLGITQGASRTVKASNITDANGAPIDVTGWSVRAVIRQAGITGPVVAEWSTSPTGSQGHATASAGEVTLAITPAMSTGWTWSTGVLQAKITEPGLNGRVERLIDKLVYLDFEAVT